MKKEDIVWIGIKILGLYLILLSIINFVSLVSSGVIILYEICDTESEFAATMKEYNWIRTFQVFWYSAFRFVSYFGFGYYFLFHGKFVIKKAFPHCFEEKQEIYE